MSTKRKTELVTALFTAAGIILLAFYERHRPIPVAPETFFYIAAAICLLPALVAIVRCKGLLKKQA